MIEVRPLRVKLGIDPSASQLTLGHAVVLRKRAQFQRFGHTLVLIIGNFTGLIGDHSGRSQTRKQQTEDEVAGHARTYLEQIGKTLDINAAEVRWNAAWLAPMIFAEVARLASHLTVAKLLERTDQTFNLHIGRELQRAHGQPGQVVLTMPLLRGTDSAQKMSKSLHIGVYMGGRLLTVCRRPSVRLQAPEVLSRH